MRRAGLAAAVALAREQRLPADDPRVLSSRGNLLVHLAPAPVVARVATLTAWTRSDPFVWLAREVAVAGYAVQNGGPVVALAQQAEPGPHWSRGLAVSLWTWVPPSQARPGPAEVGEALARLHLAAAGFGGELGFLSPVRAQIADGLAALERERVLEPALLAALRDRHAEVLADTGGATGPSLVLHGDAHAGNLLHAAAARPGADWIWIDLEETCRGPREFDLAVLAASQAANAAEALAAYARVTGEPTPAPEALAPFSRARDLEAAVWILGMAHQYPARSREKARPLLDRVLRNSPPAR
jgi:hypothetical protein